MNKSAEQETLADLMPWPQWLQCGGGGKVFTTGGSVLWFTRKHKKRLVDKGALILRKGPGGHLVNAPRFESEALQIMREESTANV